MYSCLEDVGVFHPDQQLAFATSKYREQFARMLSELSDNWMALVVDAVEELWHLEEVPADVLPKTMEEVKAQEELIKKAIGSDWAELARRIPEL